MAGHVIKFSGLALQTEGSKDWQTGCKQQVGHYQVEEVDSVSLPHFVVQRATALPVRPRTSSRVSMESIAISTTVLAEARKTINNTRYLLLT